MSPKLIALDFTEHDTVAALHMLLGMCENSEIAGMVFAVQLSGKRTRSVMLGATGRPASDLLVATGLTAVLQCSITQQALRETF